MKWLKRFKREPKVYIANQGQIIMVNGRVYRVDHDGLQMIRIKQFGGK